uniref:Secreted protein n=1 Tax=Arundo donax TaxID=35708 RepID=A0A0A8Y563_ARUDO
MKISNGSWPVNLLLLKVTSVIFLRLPRLAGRGPSNMLVSMYRYSSCLKFPSEDGKEPVKSCFQSPKVAVNVAFQCCQARWK